MCDACAVSECDVSASLQRLGELLALRYILKCGVGIQDDVRAIGEFFHSIGVPFAPEYAPGGLQNAKHACPDCHAC